MRSATPVGITRAGPVKTNSILNCNTKTLRQILSIVFLLGSITEIRIFELFPNRKDAFTFIERATTGRNRMLDSYLEGGLRHYRFSEHFLKKQVEMEVK